MDCILEHILYTGKHPDAGKDWVQEKGATEDKMVVWHHWLKGHEFEQNQGDSEGHGSLVCCSPWGRKESDTNTEWLSNKLGNIISGFETSEFETWFEMINIKLGAETESVSCSVISDSLQPHGLYSPWNSPGQDTRVGSLSLFQEIFPTQRLDPGLLHCRWILYQLSHKGSPGILEWIACPFTSGFPWFRGQTGFSCIAGRFFMNWAIREAQWRATRHNVYS